MISLTPNESAHEAFCSKDAVALDEAARAMRSIRRFANQLGSRGALALATEAYPDVAPSVAAKRLKAEFDALSGNLQILTAAAEQERAALHADMQPWRIAAGNRLFELMGNVRALDSQLANMARRNGEDDSKAQRLRADGVSEGEIQRIVGASAAVSASDLIARRTVLKANMEKLELFLATNDITLLPADLGPYAPNPSPQPRLTAEQQDAVSRVGVA